MTAIDPTQILAWAFVTVGVGFIAVIVWAAQGIFDRLEKLEALLASETKELRAMIHDLDKRTLKLEANCRVIHSQGDD